MGKTKKKQRKRNGVGNTEVQRIKDAKRAKIKAIRRPRCKFWHACYMRGIYHCE
jgi:hypothetical protein